MTVAPFCLPLIKSRKIDVLNAIQKNIRNYSYFEIWLDYIEDLDNKFIHQQINTHKDKVIFVLRRKDFKENHLNLKKRIDLISNINNSPSLLDLNINTQKEELAYIESHSLKIKTIISYHDYQKTPNDKELNEIIDAMIITKPNILKVATFCNDPQDALRLLRLLLKLKQRNIKCIILGMGKFGTITRIYGSLWGNELIFAPVTSAEKSAEGQLTIKQLQTMFSYLKL